MNQQKVLSAFKEQKPEDEFTDLLKCPHVDIDYFYGHPDNGTLLDLVCRSSGNGRYASILILNGASIWLKNPVTGKFALNEAISNSDPDTIQQLSIALRQRITTAGDEFANTLMRKAIEINDVDILRFLACCLPQTIEYNPKAAHFVLLRGSVEAVRVFNECFDIDEEFQRDSRGRVYTCREIILHKYPQLETDLRSRARFSLPKILFSYLRRGAPELFLRRMSEIDPIMLNRHVTEDDEKTYLYVACEYNHIKVVDALLERDAHLNHIVRDLIDFNKHGTPIMIAAYKGHYEIVSKLLAIPSVELQVNGIGSILHSVIRGMNQRTVSGGDHQKILQLLLNDPNSSISYRLDIDYKDMTKMTPLHLAIAFNNESAIRSLIQAGANVYLKDPEGKIPLTSIPAPILEDYFDSCIESDEDWIRSTRKEKIITFDYRIFKKLDQNSLATGHEMEFFAQIKKVPEMRTLFKHPLSKSFLYVKWCLVKNCYYINLAFYLLFWFALSKYIFQVQDYPLPLPLTSSKISGSNVTGIEHFTTSNQNHSSSWLRLITILLFIVLILRELFQFFVSIRSHFNLLENWLEFVMILVIGYFFLDETNSPIAATAILTSWIELVFLLGKYPLFSIYIEMFKTVALNFAKFLLLYSILLASFAYSFFILFRDKTRGYVSSSETRSQPNAEASDQGDKNSINLWLDPKVSVIKSILMMNGEFDASTLPLGANFNYGYVLFVIFVFLVTMVLCNLLNGLAVNDTQAIMEDAEVVALISRVKLISQLEHLAISNPFQYLRSYWPRCLNRRPIRKLETGCISFRNEVFSDRLRLAGKKVSVRPSQDNKIRFSFQEVNIGNMPSDIVKQSERILDQRNQSNSVQNTRDQNLPTNAMIKQKNESSEELARLFGEQMRHFILEIDEKILQNNLRNDEREKKLLQSIDQRIDKSLKSLVQQMNRSSR